MSTTSNPVIEIYKGVKIRKQNRIKILLNQTEFKELLDYVVSTSLSVKRVLALSGTPCERCKGIDILCYDECGNSHKIKRGILKQPHQSSGLTIIKHAESNSTCPEHIEAT